MKVSADQDACIAAGLCVATAPEVFDQRDEDGAVVVLQEQPSSELHDAVHEAEKICPAFAIKTDSGA
jgi:ferredoxin